jgi:hypothetical protein
MRDAGGAPAEEEEAPRVLSELKREDDVDVERLRPGRFHPTPPGGQQ